MTRPLRIVAPFIVPEKVDRILCERFLAQAVAAPSAGIWSAYSYLSSSRDGSRRKRVFRFLVHRPGRTELQVQLSFGWARWPLWQLMRVTCRLTPGMVRLRAEKGMTV